MLCTIRGFRRWPGGSSPADRCEARHANFTFRSHSEQYFGSRRDPPGGSGVRDPGAPRRIGGEGAQNIRHCRQERPDKASPPGGRVAPSSSPVVEH